MRKMKKEKKDKRVFDAEGNVVKKPFYKRTWFIVLAVFMVFALLLGDDEDVAEEAPEEPIVEEVAVAEETEVEEVKEEPEIETVATEMDLEEEAFDDDFQTDILEEMMLLMFQESFDGDTLVRFEKDAKLYIFTPLNEDIGLGAVFAAAGNKENLEAWDYLVESMRGLSETITEQLGSGYSVALVNPANHDNYLALIIDGVVVFDAVRD